MATINDVYGNGETGLWGLVKGYDVVFPLMLSLLLVIVGVCVFSIFEKKNWRCFMKKIVAGGFLSAVGSIRALAILVSASNSLSSKWDIEIFKVGY